MPLTKKTSLADWIKDFTSSNDPRFEGKSNTQRIKQAIGAYYGTHNEEVDSLNAVLTEAIKASHALINKVTNDKKRPVQLVHMRTLQPGDTVVDSRGKNPMTIGHEHLARIKKMLGEEVIAEISNETVKRALVKALQKQKSSHAKGDEVSTVKVGKRFTSVMSRLQNRNK